MKKIVTPICALVLLTPAITFGATQIFDTSGSFTVPAYTGSITVEVWGGGGGGGQYYTDGTAGGDSSFDSLIARGGGKGRGSVYASWEAAHGPGGAGGVASGGDVNLTGGVGGPFLTTQICGGAYCPDGTGGSSPNGGSGGEGNLKNTWTPRGDGKGFPGQAPGGGGGAGYGSSGHGYGQGNGGGGGGYASKTYSASQLAPGTVVAVTVGSGGAGGPPFGAQTGGLIGGGGAGAPGRVVVTWIDADEPPPPPPPPPAPTSCSITFSQNPIQSGSSATLSWTSSNATTMYLMSIGYVPGSGSITVSPLATTDYSGTAEGPGGTFNCQGILTVETSSCPAGQTWNGTTCVTECPAGQVWNGSACVSQCPAGETWNGSSCVPQCSGGRIWDGASCVCPAGLFWDGSVCVASCTATNMCMGDDLMHRGTNCALTLVEKCAYGCDTGSPACKPPPDAINFSVVPKLVQRGSTVSVEWSTTNMQECTVSSTNGSTWTGLSGTKESLPITDQTIFTIKCKDMTGITVTRAETVNIVPIFCEPGTRGC